MCICLYLKALRKETRGGAGGDLLNCTYYSKQIPLKVSLKDPNLSELTIGLKTIQTQTRRKKLFESDNSILFESITDLEQPQQPASNFKSELLPKFFLGKMTKDFLITRSENRHESTVDGDQNSGTTIKPDPTTMNQLEPVAEVSSVQNIRKSEIPLAGLDSHHQQKKLLMIDLEKIRNNLCNKINNVCGRIRDELEVVRNTGHCDIPENSKKCENLEKDQKEEIQEEEEEEEEDKDKEDDENEDDDEEEEDKENLNRNQKPELEDVGPRQKPASKLNGNENAAGPQVDRAAEENHNVKLLKKIAFKSFEQSLSKYGFSINSKNSFIAEGGFGTVVRVYKNGRKYACKVISNILFRLKSERGHVSTVKMHSRFANEVEIMQMVSHHPNIVQFVDSFSDEIRVRKVRCGQKSKLVLEVTDANGKDQNADEDEGDTFDELVPSESTNSAGAGGGENYSEAEDDSSNQLTFKSCFIVMEYANARTLSAYMKNRRSLPEDMVSDVFRQVTDAVQFLHESRIVHRDIKLSNLLMQRRARSQGRFNYTVKLCDFGLSNLVDRDEDGTFMKPVGTSFYMAPEILRAYYYYNRKRIDRIVPYCGYKGDIWALGVCLFYCLHGYYPLDILCKCNKQERIKALEKIFGDIDEQSESEYSEATIGGGAGGGGGGTDCEKLEPELDIPNNYYYGNYQKKRNQKKTGKREIDYEAIRAQNAAIRKVLKNYYQKIGYNCKEILSMMLEVDSDRRATIEQVRLHAFFNHNQSHHQGTVFQRKQS